MENSEEGLDRIESQRQADVSYSVRRSRYFPKFFFPIPLDCVGRENEAMWSPTEVTEPVNIRLDNLFDLPDEYVTMTPNIFSAVSAGKTEWMEELRSKGILMECLKSDQGDSVLHLAAAWGHLELVKKIVIKCPPLLLQPNSKDQLPLHVAARDGNFSVVKALVATVKFASGKLSEAERERLNVTVRMDINGNTPLHLALYNRHRAIASCLINANRDPSFLQSKKEISPLFLAVYAGDVSIVKAMLKTTKNDGAEGWISNLDSYLEGRKDLVHAALSVRNTDMLVFLLEEYPSLEDELDKQGRTCLAFAVSMGYYEGVRYLLNRSTKGVYICNNDGSFPIHIAVEKCRSMKVFKEIRRCCPDSVYLLNKQGQNIIHIAAKSQRPKIYFFALMWHTRLMENQDMDGNTPLHLATINWSPRSIDNIFMFSQRTSMYTRNNQGKTPLHLAKSNLQPTYIFIERVTLMVLLYHYSQKPAEFETIRNRSDPPAGEKNKDYVNTLLVVAALVATVTFAAGFTIPGGFSSSTSNLGMATLAKNPKLVFFMVFDILAMQSSIITIATLIRAQLGNPTLIHRSLNVALPSLFFALLCLPVAFYFGVLVAFSHVKGLVIFLNVTTVIFVWLMLSVLGPHVFLHIPGIPSVVGACLSLRY